MDRHRRALTRGAIVALPVAFLAIFFGWPLAAILERSLVVDGSVDLPFDVLTRSSTREVAWFTLWQATVSTVLTLIAGLPLAWALARFRFRGRSVVEALVLVPFVLPTVVVATAFLALLPDGVERTVWAILLAHVFFNVAVVVRVVGAFWAGLDERLWDAAATLGASPVDRQVRVTAPLLAPALASAASIVFLFCFTSFGVIVVLGGPRYATLETEIYNQAARLFDLRTAAALGLLQLAAVAATVLVSGRLERRLGGRRRQPLVVPVAGSASVWGSSSPRPSRSSPSLPRRSSCGRSRSETATGSTSSIRSRARRPRSSSPPGMRSSTRSSSRRARRQSRWP